MGKSKKAHIAVRLFDIRFIGEAGYRAASPLKFILIRITSFAEDNACVLREMQVPDISDVFIVDAVW
jgi:hypothetical protein